MVLESYTCELCILQMDETVEHLFFRCNFAKNCWNSIGIPISRRMSTLQIVNWLKNKLAVPFYMDIRSIWTTRNDWIFDGKDPTVQNCRQRFFQETTMVLRRVTKKNVDRLKAWIQSNR